MNNYIITGGAGFIGSHLADALLEDGHGVDIVDDFSTGSYDNFEYKTRRAGSFTIHERDITKDGLPDFSNADVVIHLASIPTPAEYTDDPVTTLQLGSSVTQEALELARKHDATFLFSSTSEVYGDPEIHPQPEAYNGNVDPYTLRASYDESKRYAEALIRAYHEEYNLDTKITRIFNTYGPRMRDGRVIPVFIQQALNNEDLTVHGHGSQTRSFCYIDDLVAGLRLLLQSDIHSPVNLGNTEEYSIAEVADIIRDVVGSESGIIHTERPDNDPERRRPNITKAKEELGWEPSTPFQEGLEKTVEWYR